MQWKRIFRYRINKVRRKEGKKCEQVNGSEQLSLKYPDFLEFSSLLKCCSMLKVKCILGYTWLSKCVFFSSYWLHFYFTGYLIIYWWKRTTYVVVVMTKKKTTWISRGDQEKVMRNFQGVLIFGLKIYEGYNTILWSF